MRALPASFTWLPAPTGPQCTHFSPTALKMGSARASAASLAPTMRSRVPFSAPFLLPVTGASTKSSPWARARASMLRAWSGPMVLKSTSSCPFRAVESRPSGPARTDSSAAGVATQVHAASTSDISCAGVSATLTPSGRRGAARSAVRFHTVTWKPLVARFFAIRDPHQPEPEKPHPLDAGHLFAPPCGPPPRGWPAPAVSLKV